MPFKTFKTNAGTGLVGVVQYMAECLDSRSGGMLRSAVGGGVSVLLGEGVEGCETDFGAGVGGVILASRFCFLNSILGGRLGVG